MQKTTAIALLGGDTTTAARALGITRQAVHNWPAKLPKKTADMVLAAKLRLEWRVAREQLPGLRPHPLIADAIEL